MNTVAFPGFNLEFTINNIAFEIGNICIYWYAIFIVLGFIVGLILCKIDDGKYGIKFDNILEAFLYVMPCIIVGARLYFVLFHLHDYLINPINIINIRNGGLAIYGGIIGAVLSIIVYCKIKKINILDMFDYCVMCLPIGQAIGRWGNFFNIEAYGYETSNIFRMRIVKSGEYIDVHPTFLYESVASLIIFFIIFLNRKKRKYRGQITCIYMLLYGTVRFFIEGLRTDSLMLGNFRISQLVSLIIVIISIIVLVKNKWFTKSKLKA